MKRNVAIALLGALVLIPVLARCSEPISDYMVVVSQKTHADPEWRRVVDELRQKHHAPTLGFEASIEALKPRLRAQFPRYICFVARPEEVSREFVAAVHRLTREFDDDPYPDCRWGILTGYDAANALRIARCREPLVVRKVAAGTEVALDMCEEGLWYCELNKGKMVKKEKGGAPAESRVPSDTTEALVKALTEYQPDLFVTSGHATERDWMIGFRYKNGFFKHENGRLYGLDTQGRKHPIESPNPKVYMPIGNCLMGHIDRADCMALSWMNSAGVNQMMGYTVPTWYGYAGWGCLDYFIEQPGRYTYCEAFLANQVALIHRLQTYFPDVVAVETDANGETKVPLQVPSPARESGLTANDAGGLLFDRNVVAFYGDPKWEARMAKAKTAWDQTLSEKDGIWTFEVRPNLGDKTFAPINRNGTQRGGRPIVEFLPQRVREVEILEGGDLCPVIADDFVLIPNPGVCDPARKYRVTFRAKPMG